MSSTSSNCWFTVWQVSWGFTEYAPGLQAERSKRGQKTDSRTGRWEHSGFGWPSGTVPTISDSCSCLRSLDVLGATWVAPHSLMTLLMRLRRGKNMPRVTKLETELGSSPQVWNTKHYFSLLPYSAALWVVFLSFFFSFVNKVVTVLVLFSKWGFGLFK